MPRPHGLPRWVLLALACAALFAVAMIPRGVVRAVEVSQLPGTPVVDDSPRVEAPEQVQVELPGVRALVAREEHDLPVPAPLDTAAPGGSAVHEVDADLHELPDDPVPAGSQLVAAPSPSRAPPASN